MGKKKVDDFLGNKIYTQSRCVQELDQAIIPP